MAAIWVVPAWGINAVAASPPWRSVTTLTLKREGRRCFLSIIPSTPALIFVTQTLSFPVQTAKKSFPSNRSPSSDSIWCPLVQYSAPRADALLARPAYYHLLLKSARISLQASAAYYTGSVDTHTGFVIFSTGFHESSPPCNDNCPFCAGVFITNTLIATCS